jgi:6-phosphogluconolactonase (cycloisomerase 2 family)
MRNLLFISFVLATYSLQALNRIENVVITPKANVALDSYTLVNTVSTGERPYSITYSHNGRFAAVPNSIGNSVSVYLVDCDTQAFSHIQTVRTGNSPLSVAYSPSDEFAAVANSDTNLPNSSITVYKVDSKTGIWSHIQTIRNATNPEVLGPTTIKYSPNGRFVAVANQGGLGNVSLYRVHPITGTLTHAFTTTFTGIEGPSVLDFSPDGNFLSVTLIFASQLITYEVDQITGDLTQVGAAVATGASPWGITYQHDGNFAAVANNGDNNVSVYRVNKVTGAFTPIAGSPFATGLFPYYISFSEDDLVAAVGNSGSAPNSGSVTLYCVNPSTGSWTLFATIPNLEGSRGVDFAPCSDYLGVSFFTGNEASVYKIDKSPCQ